MSDTDNKQSNIKFDIESSDSEVEIIGDSLFGRRKTKIKKKSIIRETKEKVKKKIKNFFSKREYSLLPILVRKNLNRYGNEKIEKITIVRTPIEKEINALLSILTRNKYNRAVKESGYDSMFHLALFINGKFLFDKQEVVHFEEKNPIITSKSQTLNVFLPNDFDITIRDLVVKAKEFMGDREFNYYDAFNNNCQDFLVGVMKANNLDDQTYINFIKQDGKAVLKKLPKYTAKMSRLLTDIGAVAEKIQHGSKLGKQPWKQFLAEKTRGKKFGSRQEANEYMREVSRLYREL